nr:uncharacterized protein LOC109156773 [Ipomoea batatas]
MSPPLLPAEQSSIDYKSHNIGFTQAEEMVNTDVVSQKRWRQLKTSIVLGDYDMKDEKNSNEEEVEIPPQYRERAQNWKMQMRKRSPSGKVEKFFYREGVRKTYRSVPEVTSYILQGHAPAPRSSMKRNGEASSTSKNEKKAKEEEMAKEDCPPMKANHVDEVEDFQNLLRYVD